MWVGPDNFDGLFSTMSFFKRTHCLVMNALMANSAHSVHVVCRRTGFFSHLAGPSVGIVTWLILPVVICLSQRLSHACLSINKFIL
jgi:hypothetical protein